MAHSRRMGYWRRTKGGRWKASIYVGGGKRIWARFGTETEAKQWIARMTTEKAAGTVAFDARLTVEQYLRRWLDDHKLKLSPTMAVRYVQLIDSILVPGLGTIKLSKLSPSHLASFYANKTREGTISTTTLNFAHRMLHTALRDALRRGLVLRNVADAAFTDAPRKRPFTATVWDHEACRLFLAEARRSSQHYALWLTMITTGIREGEALGLSWDSVNLDLQEVRIEQKFYRLYKGKGKGTELIFAAPKTANAARTVPILPAVVAELRKLREGQRQHREAFGPEYDPEGRRLVFCDVRGRPLHVRNLVVRDFLKVIERAKVPRCRVHDLRHATASYLAAQGTDINTISKLLGHHDAAFTLKTYVGNLGTDAAAMMRRDAIARLEGSLFATTEKEG